MKKSPITWLLVFSLGLLFISWPTHNAGGVNTHLTGSIAGFEQVAANTPVPTVNSVDPTPQDRAMPPVWSNAGLVLGASILVLIIVGGVLVVRLREKH